jgi:hypothetical protein
MQWDVNTWPLEAWHLSSDAPLNVAVVIQKGSLLAGLGQTVGDPCGRCRSAGKEAL